MRETGEVVNTSGDTVTVRIKRTSACAHCKACDFGMNSDEMRVTAKNACNAKTGDRVRVELKPESFISAALILYGLPLIGLLAGVWLGSVAGTWMGLGKYSAFVGFAGGLALAALAYAVIKKREPYWRSKGYTPMATGIVEE